MIIVNLVNGTQTSLSLNDIIINECAEISQIHLNIDEEAGGSRESVNVKNNN